MSPVGLEWLLGMKDAPCWLVRLRPRMHTIRKARAVLHHPADHPRRGAVHDAPVLAGRCCSSSPRARCIPLWYSPFMPVFFFISSMVAGLSMVIFEGTLSHKALHNKMDETHLREADGVVFGFGRAASFVLIGYFIIKVLDTTMDNDWHYLASGYGAWFARRNGRLRAPARLPVRPRRARKRTSRSFVWRRCSACSASSSTASTCASWPSTGSWTARIATSRASRKCSCPSLS